MRLSIPSFLTRNILLLSLVSFFTDIASEMLYPIMPLYLSSIGYGVVLIGFLEGSALLVAGFIKLYAGAYSDHLGNRVGFVRTGYGLSALAKPMMAVFPGYVAIFGFRMVDRVGKGFRTAPRDALLADESSPGMRGRVFGFHRSMDTIGASIGPVISLVILYFLPGGIRTIILLTIIPGLLALGATMLVRRPQLPVKTRRPSIFVSINTITKKSRRFFKESTPQYKRVVAYISLITLLKSTDVFLLLRAQELGLSSSMVVGLYVVYNVAMAALVYPLGTHADKFGFKTVFAFALLALAGSFALFGQTDLSLGMIVLAFVVYAVLTAVFEGMSSAWVSMHVSEDNRATGLGVSMAAQAICAFTGSLLMGLGWKYFSSSAVFMLVATAALAAAVALKLDKSKI